MGFVRSASCSRRRRRADWSCSSPTKNPAAISSRASCRTSNKKNFHMTTLAYEERKQRLSEVVRANRAASLRLDKPTSNLFRDRKDTAAQRLDVRQFTAVLGVDAAAGTIDVEGMATYDTIVAAALAHGVMPAV